METLGKIFGSDARVKIMRLFLFNKSQSFDIDDVADRSLVARPEVRKTLTALTKIGFLRRKEFTKKIPLRATKSNPQPGFRKKKVSGWTLDKSFDLIDPLSELLINSELVREKDLLARFKKIGSLQLCILSGLFVQRFDDEVDIFLVADRIKRDLLVKEVRKLESEIGRELSYAVFDTKEFLYRLSMYDKLARHVLENEHRVLLNKIPELNSLR